MIHYNKTTTGNNRDSDIYLQLHGNGDHSMTWLMSLSNGHHFMVHLQRHIKMLIHLVYF